MINKIDKQSLKTGLNKKCHFSIPASLTSINLIDRRLIHVSMHSGFVCALTTFSADDLQLPYVLIIYHLFDNLT